MIKVVNRYIKTATYCMKLKEIIFIHPITLALFAGAYMIGFLKQILILYGVVMVHEVFHIIAARMLKIQLEGIKVMPFGVTLNIKSNYINSPINEVIIAAAGPFANILMILIANAINSYCLFHTDDMNFFILSNFGLLAANLLPALPLDGGRILRAILTTHWGYLKSFDFMLMVTRGVIIFMVFVGLYALYITHFNYSIFLIAAFLFYNLIAEMNNRNLVMMREIIYCKEKLMKKGVLIIKNIAAIQELPARRLLKFFGYSHFFLITVIDEKMAIVGTLTEVQIIEGLLDKGTQVLLKELME